MYLIFVIKGMSKLFTIMILIFIPIVTANAQHVGSMNWSSEEDFKQDEKYIVEDILWLEENPLASLTNDTKAISSYVLNWLSNTPYISVTLDEIFLEGISNNKKYKYAEKFRVTYLFGKSLYEIQHQGNDDEVMASARGIEGMAKVYMELKKSDPSAKNRLLEKYAKMVKNNRIESYVRTEIQKNKTAAIN